MTANPPFHSFFENTAESMKDSILHHLKFSLAHDVHSATKRDWWLSTAKAVQERIIERMMATQAVHNQQDVRRVYYLSLEFLMGRLFSNSLYNAGVHEQTEIALKDLGLDLDELRGEEYDMGLGNGGLGRLAACFLDSLATLDYPAIGYGIRYEFGLFRQEFNRGYQVELPDDWMRYGTPWEIVRPEYTQMVELYGHVENVFDDKGNYVPRWLGTKKIVGIPYDIPIPGYGTNTVNFLRLWESRPSEKINLEAFNRGGYSEALAAKTQSETVSKVLYPNDKTEAGKELRLIQQYFFVSCSLRDIIRRFTRSSDTLTDLWKKAAIQLNDTHPAIAVVELLRILHDEHEMAWDAAWEVVTKTFAYTNHTLLPEALEKWSVPLFQKVLPRHLQLIFEINKRLLDAVEIKWPGNAEKKRAMSLIEEGGTQMVRMANLAVVGSNSVNGVAALHTELLKKHLFADFDAFYPGKFNNKTNGITPRRWLQASNPRLSALITSKIGDAWVKNLGELRKLEQWAGDPQFQIDFMAVKHANKVDLAKIILRECGIVVNPDSMFDVQIKRLHEYKRQHLNLLHILALYRRILQNPHLDIQPRVFIFAAKAAPGYDLAKCIIKAINAVGAKINSDPRIGDKIKVAFLPNYRVSLASRIIPAADVSEQISTAGKEASGTGNMKLALNGALTVGTLDGANVEIGEEVGADNIFIFGLTVDQVEALWRRGYNPHDYYLADEELRAIVDWVGSNYFTPDEPGVLGSLKHSLLGGGDPYLCLADFRSYSDAQAKVDAAYHDKPRWAKMAILNTARVDKFSSDRTIHEYARDIWRLPQVPV
ncbi:MAG TPA: glycogen/starch/alpha-glucan phosphorylase [Candidatus Methylacidiphilales bacterium]|nr:glycogen/starch/alpha-glucan phosphorylase [Candidatus Methylacidiphilales bacterium]